MVHFPQEGIGSKILFFPKSVASGAADGRDGVCAASERGQGNAAGTSCENVFLHDVFFFVRFDFVLQLVPKYFGSVVSVVFILFFPWDVSIICRSTSHKSRNFEIPLLYGLLL